MDDTAGHDDVSRTKVRPILISNSFAQAAEGVRESLLSVGRHSLRGVREAQEVFTIYT